MPKPKIRIARIPLLILKTEIIIMASKVFDFSRWKKSNACSYTNASPPARGDKPRVWAGGLLYVQVGNDDITVLFHLL